MANPIPPPDSYPITWQPNSWAPVFYGHRDYGPGQGNAPVPLRVFFPSLDASPAAASILTELQWVALSAPKHRAVFANGLHFDYLPPGQSPCHPSRGPCPHIPAATADLLTMFFGKYLPPELSPHLPFRIPSDHAQTGAGRSRLEARARGPSPRHVNTLLVGHKRVAARRVG